MKARGAGGHLQGMPLQAANHFKVLCHSAGLVHAEGDLGHFFVLGNFGLFVHTSLSCLTVRRNVPPFDANESLVSSKYIQSVKEGKK